MIDTMPPRDIQIIAFCSAKGGVGKSSLSVATAVLLSRRGERVVVLDLDMTGTSLADGLRLVAPAVPEVASGYLDLTRSANGAWLTPDETRRRRRLRALEDAPRRMFLPYLNDLFYIQDVTTDPEDEAVRLDAVLWRGEADDGVRYLPSSPIEMDVTAALHQLYVEERNDWERQLAWLMVRLAAQMPDLSTLVLDCPPGLHGFADRALHAATCLAFGAPAGEGWPPVQAEVRWSFHPRLIMTQDRADLRAALEWRLLYDATQMPNLVPVVNRVTASHAQILARVSDDFPFVPVHERIRFVDMDSSALGKLFWDGTVDAVHMEGRGAGRGLLEILNLMGSS